MGGGFAALRQGTWDSFPTRWEIPAASDNGRLKPSPLAFVALNTVGDFDRSHHRCHPRWEQIVLKVCDICRSSSILLADGTGNLILTS